MDKKALIEVTKSFGRFLWFGILGLIGTFLTGLVTSGQITNVIVVILGQRIDLTLLILAAITGLVKLIDRYVKANDNIPTNGIAPGFLQR